MYYFDKIGKYRILKSTLLQDINAFFTTRDGFDFNLISSKRIITPNQTHSGNVQLVDERIEYPETDGLIISSKNDLVYLRFADCTPLIFYDRKHKISAISHAGWKGTFKKIALNTIDKMHSYFKTSPENLIVLIGPAISGCCYEVGQEVKDNLLSTVKNSDGLYKGNFVDLKKINERQLREAGVVDIDICPYCTSCNNNLFFSYRKENGTKERHYAVVA